MSDKIIEYKGKNYSLRKILDSEESWQRYVNGSDKFKVAVEMGVTMQLAQVDSLFAEVSRLASQKPI